MRLRFKGWGPDYDETVRLDSGRVRILKSHTPAQIEKERANFLGSLGGYGLQRAQFVVTKRASF